MFLSFRVRVLLPLWLSWHVPWCSTCEWRTLRLSNGCAGKKTFLFLCLFIFIFWKSYFDQIFTSLISPSILLVFSCCFWSLPKLCMVFCGSVKSTSWLLICTLTVWVTWYHLTCQLVEKSPLFIFRLLRQMATGRVETRPRLAPRPTVTTPTTLTDGPVLWHQMTATTEAKDKKNANDTTHSAAVNFVFVFCIFRSVLRPWFCLSFSYRFFSPT